MHEFTLDIFMIKPSSSAVISLNALPVLSTYSRIIRVYHCLTCDYLMLETNDAIRLGA
jgi:hypothetical protein